MNCHACKSKDSMKKIRIPEYRYTESGLPNVILLNIPGLKCNHCKSAVADIPAPLKLHEMIATALINKPFILSREEIRFLRTQLGYSQVDFADKINRDQSYLNRVENGNNPVTEDLDRLIRLFYLKEKENPKRTYEALENLISAKDEGLETYRMRPKGNHWTQTSPKIAA